MMQRLKDRQTAGQMLARALRKYQDESDVVVLALPRGGVPVAYEVARALRAPMDVLIVRKLGVPGHEELAMGAIANGGLRVLNESTIRSLRIPDYLVEQVTADEREEIERRAAVYRQGQGPLNVQGQTVILVDDGLATGSTMLAALRALRTHHPARIVAAVPLAPASTCEMLRDEADEVICMLMPEPFYGVGMWYEDFTQTTDQEVIDLLQKAQAQTYKRTPSACAVALEVTIQCGAAPLRGILTVIPDSSSVVLFAHGSGSGRLSPRNQLVARRLQAAGISTLLFDLLTGDEEKIDLRTGHMRFDIPFLARRLQAATEWIQRRPDTSGLAIGFFGASTGAAAALQAAAACGPSVQAVVSRGGRPDLAGGDLTKVRCPTLMIVGGEDAPVIELNRQALDRMRPGLGHITIIPGATHLFPEKGALEQVASLAADWFDRHLGAGRSVSDSLSAAKDTDPADDSRTSI
jgi:putative phosphoribosyl transferase